MSNQEGELKDRLAKTFSSYTELVTRTPLAARLADEAFIRVMADLDARKACTPFVVWRVFEKGTTTIWEEQTAAKLRRQEKAYLDSKKSQAASDEMEMQHAAQPDETQDTLEVLFGPAFPDEAHDPGGRPHQTAFRELLLDLWMHFDAVKMPNPYKMIADVLIVSGIFEEYFTGSDAEAIHARVRQTLQRTPKTPEQRAHRARLIGNEFEQWARDFDVVLGEYPPAIPFLPPPVGEL